MSGKTGKKPTGRKPLTVRRRGPKTDGAFGKEQSDQVRTEEELNVDKAVMKRIAGGGS